MKTTIRYDQATAQERDEAAYADVVIWCNEDSLRLLTELAELFDDGAATIQHMFMGLEMAGIQGLPAHAFMRKHCLTAYRAWMASGDTPVATDEQGFPIETVMGEMADANAK